MTNDHHDHDDGHDDEDNDDGSAALPHLDLIEEATLFPPCIYARAHA